MTYQVLTPFKVKTNQGERVLSAGNIINLNPSKAETLLFQGKIKPAPAESCLDAILSKSVDRIVQAHQGRQYHATAEIKQAEDEIDRIYKAVIEGQAGLSDFQDACNRWESLFYMQGIRGN